LAINNQLNARDEMQMLTFSLDNVIYGVNVTQVREVKNFEGVTPVPYAPAYVKGVTNLRGEVVPVLDLRKRFEITNEKAQASNIMIIVQDKNPVGIVVDSVMEVLTLPKSDIEANPNSLIVDKSAAIIGIAKHDKDLILLLDLIKVVSREALNMKDECRGFNVKVQSENP
jgi:purine-binding chemotaxis protein CheW